MRPLRCWRFSFAVVAALLTGCASTRVADTLDARLVNLRFEQMTAFETTAVFFIRLQNQSPDAVSLRGSVHKIYLNGNFIGSGVSDQSVELAPFREETLPVTVHLRNYGVARLLRDIIQARRADYRMNSLLYTGGTSGSGKVRLERAGAVDVADFQPRPASPLVPAQ